MVFDHGFLHIIRYIDQYRPRTSASRDLEGKMHGLFQLFRLIHKEILLRDRHGDAADVDFLKGIVAMVLRFTCPVMATTGIESRKAFASPVTRFVAPGPEVAQQTPTVPLALA